MDLTFLRHVCSSFSGCLYVMLSMQARFLRLSVVLEIISYCTLPSEPFSNVCSPFPARSSGGLQASLNFAYTSENLEHELGMLVQ
jgi:hypothetical protein